MTLLALTLGFHLYLSKHFCPKQKKRAVPLLHMNISLIYIDIHSNLTIAKQRQVRYYICIWQGRNTRNSISYEQVKYQNKIWTNIRTGQSLKEQISNNYSSKRNATFVMNTADYNYKMQRIVEDYTYKLFIQDLRHWKKQLKETSKSLAVDPDFQPRHQRKIAMISKTIWTVIKI